MSATAGAAPASQTTRQLVRLRWAVRSVLVLGVAASVVANVLHALSNPISQAIAAWPPLALLLTVELISRIPVHRRWLGVVRIVATATIAGIAAWVSYWHMVAVASRYGETGASPYLIPVSVDGLIVVASICLVELGGRISATADTANPAQPANPPANRPPANPAPPANPPANRPPANPAPPANPPANRPPANPAPPANPPANPAPPVRVYGVRPEVVARIAAAYADTPGASQETIAKAAGVSLRQVGRYAASQREQLAGVG